MAHDSTYQKHQLISDFLRRLEEDEYPVGTGQHLRLQEFLDRLPEDTPLERLHSYIIPLFAKGPSDQVRFQQYFRDALEYVNEVDGASLEIPRPIQEERNWEWWIWGSLLLLLLPFGYITNLIREIQTPEVVKETPFIRYTHDFEVEQGMRTIVSIDTIPGRPGFGTIVGQGRDSFPVRNEINDQGSPQLPETIKKRNRFHFNVGKKYLSYFAGDSLGFQDTVFFIWNNERKEEILIGYVPNVVEAAQIELPPTLPSPVKVEYMEKKLQYSEPYARLLPPPHEKSAAYKIGRYIQAARILSSIAAILLGLLLFLQIKRFLQRKAGPEPPPPTQKEEADGEILVAEIAPNEAPPYAWNIELGGNLDISMSETMAATIRQLRARARSSTLRLDVPRTINHTIRGGGQFSPVMSAGSEPAEYLMLIERLSPNDHQAEMYDRLFHLYKKSEVLVERFFYNTDIRVLYNEEHRSGVKLAEVARRFENHRLIVMGMGHIFLHPMTGRPHAWTSILDTWSERALMTPKTMDAWSRREKRLGQLFTVMPASHEALAYWIEAIREDLDWDANRWRDILGINHTKAIRLELGLIPELEENFTEGQRVWIAACALYPSIHWDLTLHLGHFIERETGAEHLVSQPRIKSMLRLPWFAEGHIPEAVRTELIIYLQQEYPDLYDAIRGNLNAILESQQPPSYSVAFDEHRMNIALNQWMMLERPNDDAETVIDQYLKSGVEGDLSVIRQIARSEKTAGQFELPDKWLQYINEESPLVDGMDNNPIGKENEPDWRPLKIVVLSLLSILNLILLFMLPSLFSVERLECTICEHKSPDLYDSAYIQRQMATTAGVRQHLSTFRHKVFEFPLTSAPYAETDSAKVCLKNYRDWLLHTNYLILHGMRLSDSFHPDSLLKDTFRHELAWTDMEDSIVDSPAKIRKNIARSYYNMAVVAYRGFKEVTAPPRQQNTQQGLPRLKTSEACHYIRKAYHYDPNDADIRRMAKECGVSTTIPDHTPSVNGFRGTVSDLDSKEPIPAAQLEFNSGIEVVSNAKGKYEIVTSERPKGVEVSREWYMTERFIFSEGDGLPDGKIPDIELEAFRLRHQLVDKYGNGIPNATLTGKVRHRPLSLTTDKEGWFSLKATPHFPPGSLRLSVEKQGYQPTIITLLSKPSKNPRKFTLEVPNGGPTPKPIQTIAASMEVFTNDSELQGIRLDGQTVLPARYYSIRVYTMDGMEYFILEDKEKQSYLFNPTLAGSPIGPFSELSPVREGFAVYKDVGNGKYGYISPYLDMTDPVYGRAQPFNNGAATVLLNGKQIVIDTDMKCIGNCGENAPTKPDNGDSLELQQLKKALTDVKRNLEQLNAEYLKTPGKKERLLLHEQVMESEKELKEIERKINGLQSKTGRDYKQQMQGTPK